MGNNLPEYLSWVGIEQILWGCSQVMNFIYNIAPNAAAAIILYAIFSHFIFLPFTIKNGIDRIKGKEKSEKLQELKMKFRSLTEEERKNEVIVAEYKRKEAEIKGKSVKGLGCLVIALKIFILLATMPVISLMDQPGAPFYVDPAIGNPYNFLGLNLLHVPLGEDGFHLTWAILIPFFTALVLSASGFMSTRNNLKAHKELEKTKTPEEIAEEKELLKEMGIKDNKVPIGYIINGIFFVVYFFMFLRMKLSIALYWGVYYTAGIVISQLVDLVIRKIKDKSTFQNTNASYNDAN